MSYLGSYVLPAVATACRQHHGKPRTRHTAKGLARALELAGEPCAAWVSGLSAEGVQELIRTALPTVKREIDHL